ncbi:MAG: MFS transporter [Actinobacteria bacterium]|nr:MFS transporter [Actinomycetota bacterium]
MADALNVRRNTVLLAATVAVNSAVLQLVAALSSLTFVSVTGFERLLGLGPAVFLVAGALAALVAGRAMDRLGRVPVLAAGFVSGIAGALLTSLGARTASATAVVCGFVLIGAAAGTVLLSRAAAGDMYPPERRARGISFVLFGAVFGAILGPAVFGPLLAGRKLGPEGLALPWLVAAGLLVVALALVLCIRPDPKRIAELIAAREGGEPDPGPPAPLAELVRRPGVPAAMVAALASYAVMASVMNLAGYVVVQEHGHHESAVFPIIGAHVLGMYSLVLVIGPLIDRIGRRPALAGGLLLMGASCAGMLAFESVAASAVLLFGLGLGWNLSFVAATAELVDRTSPAERGKLLGFNDLLAGLLAAALALLGGYALEAVGVSALALGAAAIVLAPIVWILGRNRQVPAVQGVP